MGGWGSGRRGGRGLVTGKTSDFHAIDLAWLRRQGCLAPGSSGSLTWSRRETVLASIRYRVEADGFRLRYRTRQHDAEWHEVDELVAFVQTAACFGGRRKWFQCPSCRRRCRILYGGSNFRCRLRHRLKYEAQYESVYSRGTSRIFKIRERLCGTGGIDDPLPDKPKGMHWKTYIRLHDEAQRLQQRWATGMSLHLGLFDGCE